MMIEDSRRIPSRKEKVDVRARVWFSTLNRYEKNPATRDPTLSWPWLLTAPPRPTSSPAPGAASPHPTSSPAPGAASFHLLPGSRRRPASPPVLLPAPPHPTSSSTRGAARPRTSKLPTSGGRLDPTPSLGPGAARPPFSPGPLDAWSPTSPAPGAANRPAPLAPVAAPACSPPAGMTARIRTAWWGSESRRSGAPPPLAIGSSLFMVKPRVLVGDHKKQAVKELGDMVQRCGQFNYLNCLTGMTSDSE
ncbi:lysine-rich arabinogalactan protein 19 [Triticum aestivum]|uniref:lysine-rich arabinogalactan protein 19 n=1 Tax=Triticum aestivum TaxID=4565 RepID=UPI00098B39F5|nr:lysine-rich arabinogalactan protein 19-like [Triticum aestivum]